MMTVRPGPRLHKRPVAQQKIELAVMLFVRLLRRLISVSDCPRTVAGSTIAATAQIVAYPPVVSRRLAVGDESKAVLMVVTW